MYELWKWDYETKEFHIVGQYSTKKQAVLIAKDYQGRGFRCEVRQDDKAVWVGGYPTRRATK